MSPTTMTQPTNDPDADAYTLEQLEIYFEPNIDVYEIDNKGMERLRADKVCAYDRLANLQGPFIIYAERGLGKTHLLNLLGKQIEAMGGVFLSINPEDPGSPLRMLQTLKSKYANAPKELLYKYILMDALDERLSSPSNVKIRRLWDGITESFDNISWRIRISFTANAAGEVDVERKEKWVKALDEKTEELQKRVEKNIRILGQGKAIRSTNNKFGERIFERTLPDHKSVFVIIDKLDQAEGSPKQNNKEYKYEILESLVDLTQAVKYFNTRSKSEGLKFKIIISMRAITFLQKVNPQLTNREQYQNMIIHLQWERAAIERLLTKRILFNRKIDEQTTRQDVLASILPNKVHYFGREFLSVELLSELTGNRPRRILTIWEKAVFENYPGEKEPFNKHLTEKDLIKGLQAYVNNNILDEVSHEHELDYPSVKELLNYLSNNNKKIPRLPSKKNLLKLLQVFLDVINTKHPEPSSSNMIWLSSDKSEILQILYNIGVVGFLKRAISHQTSWPETDSVMYASTHGDLQINDYEQLIINPLLWHKLTNIDDEIKKRRAYINNLYDDMKYQLEMVDMQIQSLENNQSFDPRKFEYELAKFFVICQLIKEYYNYPEPTDWAKWKLVCERIDISWNSFASLVLGLRSDTMYAMATISGNATLARNYIVTENKTFDKVIYNDLNSFIQKEKSTAYKEAFAIICSPKQHIPKLLGALPSFNITLKIGRGNQSLMGVLELTDDQAFDEMQKE